MGTVWCRGVSRCAFCWGVVTYVTRFFFRGTLVYAYACDECGHVWGMSCALVWLSEFTTCIGCVENQFTGQRTFMFLKERSDG
jgi:hypothetical protein